MKLKHLFFCSLSIYFTLGIINASKVNAEGAKCELPPGEYTIYDSQRQPILTITTGPQYDSIYDVEMADGAALERWNRITYIFPSLPDRRERVDGYIFLPDEANCLSPDATGNDL